MHNILKPEFVAPNIRALIKDARSSQDDVSAQAMIDKLELDIRNLNRIITKTKRAKDVLQTENDGLKKRNKYEDKVFATMVADIANLEDTVSSLQKQLEERDAVITALERAEETVKGQNKIIAQFRKKLQAQTTPRSLGASAEMIAKLQEELSAVKEGITDRDNAILDHRRQISALQGELSAAKAANAAEEPDQLARRSAAEEAQAKAHEAEISRLKHRVRKYKDERNMMATSAELLKATERKLETALASLATAMSSPMVPEAEYNKVVAERDILERILSRKSE
jgi:chromosome segregation ATPase